MEIVTQTEATSPIEHRFSVEIPVSHIKDLSEKKVRSYSQRVQLKGFRKGRAPKALVETAVGSTLEAEVIRELIMSSTDEVIKQHGLRVAGMPSVDFKEQSEGEEAVRASISIPLMPQPEVADFENLEVEAAQASVTDKMVDDAVEQYIRDNSRVEVITTRGIVEAGDIVILKLGHFETTAAPAEGQETERKVGRRAAIGEAQMVSPLLRESMLVELGSSRWPQAFSDALIGAARGSEKFIEMTWPKEFTSDPENGESKDVKMRVLVAAIGNRVAPTRDGEKLTIHGERGDEEVVESELRERIAADLNKSVETRNRQELETKLMDALIARNPFDVPQCLIDEEIAEMLARHGVVDGRDQEAARAAVPYFRDSLGERASVRIKRAIALAQLANKLDVQASDEDLLAHLQKEFPGLKPEDFERFKSSDNDSFRKIIDRTRLTVRNERTLARLEEAASVRYVPAENAPQA